MTVDIETGVLTRAANQEHDGPMTIVLCDLQTIENNGSKRLVGKAADGGSTITCALGSKFLKKFVAKELASNDIVKVTSYQATRVDGQPKLMVLDMEVVGKHTGADLSSDGPTPKKMKASQEESTPVPITSPSDENVRTPVTAKDCSTFSFRTPGSAMQTPKEVLSPVPFRDSNKATRQPGAATAATLPVVGEQAHQPISALNPYNARWTLKVKVERKQDLKQISAKDGPASLLTVILVDEQGKQIEGVFWREAAEKMATALTEGRIYFISGGTVVPSNRKYSSVDNDYKINFNFKTEVKEARNQDTSKMKIVHSFVSFDCLEARLSKKLPVDLIGIVTNVGSLGTIKRNRDGTEHLRRDITVVDKSRKSVVVTIWRDQAEQIGGELEQLTHPVLMMSKMRISDYNGVSISQSYASAFEINPDLNEAEELKAWWESEGAMLSFVPAGEGISGRSAGQGRSSKWQTIADIVPSRDEQLSESDPPKFGTLRCVLANIVEDQPMYYTANTATNKKVTEQGGKYVEADGTVADEMKRRYIMNAQVTDFTGRQYINVFNAEAEAMLGSMTADQMDELKQTNPDAFARQLKASCWTEWVVEVIGKNREYEGKTRMRFNTRRARALDWVADSRGLLAAIAQHLAK